MQPIVCARRRQRPGAGDGRVSLTSGICNGSDLGPDAPEVGA
jgi:hypothetical protein